MVAVEVGGAWQQRWPVAATGSSRASRRPPPPGRLAGITGTVQSLHAVTESSRAGGASDRAGARGGPHHHSASRRGIWADLAAAAPVAAAQKLASRGDVPARVQIVCVVTEHGLLDDSAVAPGTLQTVDARVDELLRVLAVRGE
jgi:hypothetical protein